MPIHNELWSDGLYHSTFITVPGAFSLLKDDLKWQSHLRSKESGVKEGGKQLVQEGIKARGEERGKREKESLEKEPWPSLKSEKQSLHQGVTMVKLLMMGLRGSSVREICPAGPAQRGMKWTLMVFRASEAELPLKKLQALLNVFFWKYNAVIRLGVGNQSLSFLWAMCSGTSLAKERTKCKFLLHLSWAYMGCLGSGWLWSPYPRAGSGDGPMQPWSDITTPVLWRRWRLCVCWNGVRTCCGTSVTGGHLPEPPGSSTAAGDVHCQVHKRNIREISLQSHEIYPEISTYLVLNYVFSTFLSLTGVF